MKNKSILWFILFVVIFGIINIWLLVSGKLQLNAQGLGIIVASGMTIAMYSFLYKDNVLFKIAEHIYVGIAAGYTINIAWYNIIWSDIVQPVFLPKIGVAADYSVLIPTLFGALMLTRFSSKYSWMSRISLAFVVGFGAGLSIPRYIASYLIKQIGPTMMPLYHSESIMLSINAIVILIGVVSVLVYFFFSAEHKGGLGITAKVGIYFLMVSFGASFGYTIMGRISLLVGRMQFILYDWLNFSR